MRQLIPSPHTHTLMHAQTLMQRVILYCKTKNLLIGCRCGQAASLKLICAKKSAFLLLFDSPHTPPKQCKPLPERRFIRKAQHCEIKGRKEERKGERCSPWPLCALFVQKGRKNLIPRFLSDDFWQSEREKEGGKRIERGRAGR